MSGFPGYNNFCTGVDEYGRTGLWRSCGKSGDVEAVRRCLAAGANPDQGDVSGICPLHIASLNGHVEIVRILLDAGADPNAVDKHDNSPLWTVILSAPNNVKVELIEILLNAGSNPHHKNRVGKSPYAVAMEIAHGLDVPFQKHALNDNQRGLPQTPHAA
jgi:ankyrin repeat protein